MRLLYQRVVSAIEILPLDTLAYDFNEEQNSHPLVCNLVLRGALGAMLALMAAMPGWDAFFPFKDAALLDCRHADAII